MTTSSVAHASSKPRAGLIRATLRRWHLGVIALAAVSFAAPIAVLSHGTDRARVCLASYEGLRGPSLPDCRDEIRWFVTPSRVPWTATAARYRAEELNMRHAVAAYTDAAIGQPDAAALERSVDGLFAAEKIIHTGSQRVTLDELGRAVGAPDPGRSAMLLGDRRTLLARSDLWPHWSVRLRALEAALLEGDAARAAAIAKRYAEFDPRDDDLRVAVAAVLCVSGEGKRGLELLTTIQTARAKDRHESWARNWGEVRAAIVACAAKAGVPAPPLPERDGAGVSDLVAARTALRLRLVTRPSERDPSVIRDAAKGAIDLLEQQAQPKGARVRLLAALLALGRNVEPELVVHLATPRVADGEPPLVTRALDLTAVEWLEEPRGLQALVSADALRNGAAELQRMATTEGLSLEGRRTLMETASAMSFAAARQLAVMGRAAAATEVIAASPQGAAGQLALSSAWYVAGEPARALAELENLEPPAPGSFEVAVRLQRAELLASLGRREEAAREAITADDRAAALGDRQLDLRAQWTRLALARSRRSVAVAPRSLPWTGPMATPASWLDPAAESADAFAAALAFWDAARKAPAPDRRAIRYAIVEPHAGEAPRARAMALSLAAELLAPGEGDVEVWLDAISATSSRATTMRSYAFARMEAARFRGDVAAASQWAKRYAALLSMTARAEDAELLAVLGI